MSQFKSLIINKLDRMKNVIENMSEEELVAQFSGANGMKKRTLSGNVMYSDGGGEYLVEIRLCGRKMVDIPLSSNISNLLK